MLHILESLIPHVASELSLELFELANFRPLEVDLSAFCMDEIAYVISVNGKKRGELLIDNQAAKEEILSRAREVVQKWLIKEVKREVFVPGKLVNFVL